MKKNLFNFLIVFLFSCATWSAQSSCYKLFNSSRIEIDKVEIRSSQATKSGFDSKRVPNNSFAFVHPEKAFVRVAKVKGLKHTYIAVFNHAVYMNWALGRVTTHQTQGRVISDLGLSQADSVIQSYAGHDLPAHVVRAYIKAKRETDFEKHDTDPVLFEAEFWQSVIKPLLKNDPKAVLIGVSLGADSERFVSHETLHAHFYEKTRLQSAVEKFWTEQVSIEDQNLYLKVLKREGYDIENQEQVLNEFFAYTLEVGRPIIFPPALIQRYRRPLSDALKSLLK